jgi:hypothetical protein
MDSTGDPLSHVPVSEIWGIVWMRYFAAVGLVIVNYDCLLTLNDEVRLISLYLCQLYGFPRFVLFGQGPFPCQKDCITLIAIYPLSLLFLQTTVSSTIFLGGGPER